MPLRDEQAVAVVLSERDYALAQAEQNRAAWNGRFTSERMVLIDFDGLASLAARAREEERERCIKALCAFCNGSGDPVERAVSWRENPQHWQGGYFRHRTKDGLWRECGASVLRAALREGGERE